ncbi:N-acetyl-1-D-myo-inositol-2-amino-2-deoxy-alpha-D-glucopyranoside deacetylase [Corynebacterium diphtheriae]|uniref:N-acetyl-1-D-myo-inositol-2-amino-2-deoxy-alpha- D-glucopyranoside deacetylase n=1 Tax=Corynebacterium diphtheriae TaxID=1717 RepID=UPI000928758D|nr:N-acetyl-1-D-myo-inositol-2-amino-2-deoxy-alpha-D-glucopyranoside deacetylase [Corynebacterium diphtheriae]OJI01785.1 N-acetyl-1-D-myo-inositol-2-amino-2-deoxy-alpha-D-glucopyranoside deacetylase [Corynebacterium diphtheriae]OSQ09663.1 N-acetyl-1-D-myo-inositol-2-amino-2-deoxy-alpha-D-glucopyranoside deacetylase [Corynebacterium diphtheriae]
MRDLIGFKAVAVHAHPDDEAIWTGGLLANLAARGADVTVVTCTLGEEGEVIGEPYQGLTNKNADQLGGFRIHELHKSLSLLGVRGEFLGGAGCWRDSGMIGDPANEHPRAFISSGDKSIEQLTEIFERLQPDLVITYGPDGGYGHPDHIRAHNITHTVAENMDIPRILWAVTPRTELEQGMAAITTLPSGWRRALPGEVACVDPVDLTIALDDHAFAAKAAAMRAHATQLWLADATISDVNPHAAIAGVADPKAAPLVFALSNLIAQPLLDIECYQLGGGTPLTSNDPTEGIR